MSEWNATLYDNKHDFVAEYNNLAKTVIGVDQS